MIEIKQRVCIGRHDIIFSLNLWHSKSNDISTTEKTLASTLFPTGSTVSDGSANYHYYDSKYRVDASTEYCGWNYLILQVFDFLILQVP